MKKYLDENFLLQGKTAQQLFHDFARDMPVIDYHCHLSPEEIASDKQFQDLTEIWLNGDHYKWRAMRANGVNEQFITGTATSREKFQKWAETVPYTLRNPLYDWTHLELQRYFQIYEPLNPGTADAIFDSCSSRLQTSEFSTRNLMRKMKVKWVCTTDDPADSLQFHQQIRKEGFEIPVLPTFRPDAAMGVEDPKKFNAYIGKLEEASVKSIVTFQDFLDSLKSRHDYFAANGCILSDHGLEEMYAEEYTDAEIHSIFDKSRSGKELNYTETRKFKSAMLVIFSEWDHARGWVQQYHIGALRNNNHRMMETIGPDSGWDSIGDFLHSKSISRFLNTMDSRNKLAKTILYNLNPSDNELMATMIGNFNDGSFPGKIQWGSAWWFLDQKDGMKKQIDALSNMGLLSRFVGMLTDSRSFLSYPRHEYFRRILCNIFGEEVERGELPQDIPWIGKLIRDICYFNAEKYFDPGNKIPPVTGL